jgi:hypothetical protein
MLLNENIYTAGLLVQRLSETAGHAVPEIGRRYKKTQLNNFVLQKYFLRADTEIIRLLCDICAIAPKRGISLSIGF